jgi:hypothetical protein
VAAFAARGASPAGAVEFTDEAYRDLLSVFPLVNHEP